MLFSCQAAVWLSFHAKASLEYHKLFLMSRTNSKSFKHPYVKTKDLLSARIFPQISRMKKSLACETLAPGAAASATCFFTRVREACFVQCALRYHFGRLLCGPLDHPPPGGFFLLRKKAPSSAFPTGLSSYSLIFAHINIIADKASSIPCTPCGQ